MELLGCSAMTRRRWCGRSAAAQRTLRGGARWARWSYGLGGAGVGDEVQGEAGDTYRVAECIGVRAWGGKAGEILGEDHGRAGGSVAPWRGKSCQAGPTGQRAKRARRGATRLNGESGGVRWASGPSWAGQEGRKEGARWAEHHRSSADRAEEKGGERSGPPGFAGPRGERKRRWRAGPLRVLG